MNSFSGKTITVSVEFRRKLIRKIKNHPIVWQNSKEKNIDNSAQRREAWKTIEREMGYPCLLKEIQATWASLSEMYFRIIFLRTIERNFEPPVWQFFHDMSFLYDHVKETIQNQLGGISPPLFIQKPNPSGSQIPQCPCCVSVGPDLYSKSKISFVEVKEENEIQIETSFEDYQKDNDSESVHSECSLDVESSKNQSCFLTNTQKKQNIQIVTVQTINLVNPIEINSSNRKQFETHAVWNANTPPPILENTPIKVINLIDCTERNNESGNSQLTPESHSTKSYLAKSHSIGTNCVDEVIVNGMEYSAVEQSLKGVVSITQPRIGSKTQIITPERSAMSSNQVLLRNNDNCNGKEITRLVASVSNLRAITRSQIIEAVKANPATYLYSITKKKKQFLDAWAKIAEELGNVPYQALKNRWKIIKRRYLKELVLEREYNGAHKSSWECFDKLEFLRPYMQEEIDEIVRTRNQIKNTIKKKAAKFIVGGNTTQEPTEPVTVKNTISNINYVKEIANDQTPFYIHPEKIITYADGNPNIQITNVETVNSNKTDHKKVKPLKMLVVLDGNTLPILQNRPVKVTAVKVFPLIHENDKNQPNDNGETQPPAKKLRKITNFDKNLIHVLSNKTPKKSPSTKVPSLTSNSATVKLVPATKLNILEPAKPQKVFPTLDLTLDDDPPIILPPIALKEIETTRLQRNSVDECIYHGKIFPPLDLTADEDNDDDKNSSANVTISQNENKKDEDNVICLDDD